MTRSPAPELIRRALVRHGFEGVSDATLVERYSHHADSDAFGELVRRYAPLVWGVCRRACADPHVAEDAFQQTFIALARQIRHIRRAECLPGWLHGVARRIAWKARSAAKRIPATEVPDRPGASPSPLDQASGRELIEAVEAEVARLPDKYKSAVLACWFEDESLDERARRLGVSRGVLWGRLKRGRELLRRRLAARGFGLPAVVATTAIVGTEAPAALIQRAVESALRPGVGRIGPVVAAATVLKAVAAAGLCTAVVVGITTLLSGKPPESNEPPKKAEPPVAERIDDGFPLPAGAVRRFGNRQLRHPEGILASAMSPDGKLLATASYSAVVVWDLKTLSAKRVFADAQFYNYGTCNRGGRVAFYPDSKSILYSVRVPDKPGLAIGGSVDLVKVADIETGKVRFAIQGSWEYDISSWLTAGGKEIALTSNVGNVPEIHLYDARNGKFVRTVKAPHLFSTPWIAPDGERFAYQGPNGDGLGVWDVRTGKEIYSLAAGKAVEVTFCGDGKWLVVADSAGKVHVDDLEAGKELFAFDHPEKQYPGPMIVSRDRQTLYLASSNGQLFRWDLKANKPGPGFHNRHNFWSLNNLAVGPDESTLYSMSLDHLIKRWNLKTGDEILPPEGYTTQTTMAVAVDGKRLILSDAEGQVDFWDLATGRRTKQIQASHLGGINWLAQSADGRWLAGGRTSQDIRLFDLSTGKVVRDMYLGDNSDARWADPVKQVAFAPDGKAVYSTSKKTGVTAFEVPSGKRLWNAAGDYPHIACDAGGRWIAAGGDSGDQPIKWTLLDAKTGRVVVQTEIAVAEALKARGGYPYPPYVTDLRFLPDGSRLFTAHIDGTVRVWDPESRREVMRLRPYDLGGVGTLGCSPDGKWLAVGVSDGTVSVWEVATGARVLSHTGHNSGVSQVAFTRDGRKLISNADLAPVLWDLAPKDLPAVDGLPYLLWEGLKSDDAAKAYKLEWALAKKPDVAVKVFTENVKPAEWAVARAQFDKWVAALDSPRFRVREAAEKALTAAGQRVPLSWLNTALADAKSDEVRARLGRVLVKMEKGRDPDQLRLSRAVQALELAHTDHAKALLKSWADADGGRLSQDAKAALERMR